MLSVDQIVGVYLFGQTIYETAISNGCLVNVCMWLYCSERCGKEEEEEAGQADVGR